MIRVLQVVNDMHRAGLETMLMNYYRNIDRSKVQFDFLTHRPEKSDYDDEIISLGGKVYYAPRLYPQNYITYFKYMEKFWAEHKEYTIVHSHIDSMSYLPLLTAKRANIPIRIAHSHNTSIDLDFKYPLKQFFRLKLPGVANFYFACGKEAGEYLFPQKKITLIPNAIEVERFVFSDSMRKKKRKELGLENEVVIGHVGRLSYQKNHKFLIQVFNEIYKEKRDAILLLIGVGEKEEKIRKQVKNYGLETAVRFLGNRDDVNELYQAMDVFVMPSFFEGVPVTGVEAQFAGLPCVFSDKVPREVQFTNSCIFYSLKNTPKEWAAKILAVIPDFDRADTSALAVQSKYNIQNAKDFLQRLYEKF